MSVFQSRRANPAGTIGHLVHQIEGHLNQAGGAFVDRGMAKRVIAMENLDGHSEGNFTSALEGLEHAIAGVASTHSRALMERGIQKEDAEGLKFAIEHTGSQKSAAVMAGAICADVASFLGRSISLQPKTLDENEIFIPSTEGFGMSRRVYGEGEVSALEAYDDRENKETTVYSIAYNLQAATQDEFGEALFPTIVVAPDQFGATITVRLITVMNDIRRNTSGKVIEDFERINLIRAQIDPSVLQGDMTRIIPVVRDEALANFVDPALVAPYNAIQSGVAIDTAPLAIGARFDLLGISQTDALLATGTLDATDALDPNVVLDALYMSVKGTVNGTATTEVIKFANVGQMLTSSFNAAPQGNHKLQSLNFMTTALPINAQTTQADSSASVLLASIVGAGAQVKLAINVTGSVNVQTAETIINSATVSVAEIRDSSNNVLDPTVAPGSTYAALFTGAVIFGYDLEARRVNTNRRERGQLLDITSLNYIYGVPLLSPISAPRPPAGPMQDEANYLAGLITATRVRTSNSAVYELLKAKSILKNFVASNLGDLQFIKPEVLGVGGHLVQPFYEEFNYVAPAVVDSIKSYERAADVQASLVNVIRDMAYRAYRETGFKAAANAMHGGIAPMPTVIIATDTMIAAYLQVTGDFRTLGNEFNVKIVSTTNKLMKNQIIITFGEFGEGRESTPNPLHFGMMLWKPELTLILPTVRNGANSREISVSPSYRHVVNLPIMCVINVSGITAVVENKVNVNFHTA